VGGPALDTLVVRWGRGGVSGRVALVVCVLGAGHAAAVPSVERGAIRRARDGVRASVTGAVTDAEWGAPAAVRVAAGNRSESIDAAALRQGGPGRWTYRGQGTVRGLAIDLGRRRFRLKLAGIGPTFYGQPFWVTVDPATPFDFALPVAERPRTRIGGKAVHRLDGVVFGPWMDGQDPAAGATVDQKQVVTRLRRIARYTRAVRTDGFTSGLALVPALAQAAGLEVFAGARLRGDPVADQAEIDALVAACQAGVVDVALVGPNAVGDGALSESALVGRLQEVRDAVAGTNAAVAAAERWDVLRDHPGIVAASDLVAAHIQPFLDGVHVDSAIGAFNDHYQDLLVTAEGKEIVVAATGWPSAGDALGEAEPSPENAAAYVATVRTWARAENVRVFHDAAFDEGWRAASEGAHAATWGLADARGKLKPGMRAVVAGRAVARTWRSGPIGGPGDPTTEITSLPPFGSFDDLEGRVTHVVPRDYGIVVYILVADRWWVKPRDTEPVTPLGPLGTFTVDVTTGGEDEVATRFAVFLIPLSYAPPILLGEPALPLELYENAADVVEVDRPGP
jgi:exo-beta-1,3-glucanase (GH17 family)